MQEFTARYDISKAVVDDALVSAVMSAATFEKLGYDFASFERTSQSQLELVANAINEVLRYQPFLVTASGGYAHSADEIATRNYATDGYMVPRESDWSECSAKTKKKLDKVAKKSGGGYSFLMKARGGK